jgi:hypothetical protein
MDSGEHPRACLFCAHDRPERVTLGADPLRFTGTRRVRRPLRNHRRR